MYFCNVDNHKMAYQRLGNEEGQTIIFVHGISTYSFIWRKIIPYFEKNYDVICIDLMGCGESDMPLDISYSLKEHSERLLKFINVLNIDKFHLVGHDVGGGLAQIFAVKHENKLLTLTMINMVAYNHWPVQPVSAMRIPVIRQFIIGSFELGLMKVLIKAGLYHKELVTKELVDLFLKPFKNNLGRKAFMHFAKALDVENLMEIANNIKQIKIATLIIRGDADPFLSSVICEQLNKDILNSKLIRTKTASHYLMEDEPKWAAENILTFIENNNG